MTSVSHKVSLEIEEGAPLAEGNENNVLQKEGSCFAAGVSEQGTKQHSNRRTASSSKPHPQSSSRNHGNVNFAQLDQVQSEEDETEINFEFQNIERDRQLLFVFHHGSTCTAAALGCNSTTCQLTCAQTKDLKQHLEVCTQEFCRWEPHCKRMKSVLSHYFHCDKSDCVVCCPVRNNIQKCEQGVDTIRESIQDIATRKGNDWIVSSTNKRRRRPPATMDDAPQDIGSSASPKEPCCKRNKTDQCSVIVSDLPSDSSSERRKATSPFESVSSSSSLSDVAGNDPSTFGSRSMDAAIRKADGSLFLRGLSADDLKRHIAHLKPEESRPTLSSKEKAKCSKVLKGIEKHRNSWIFEYPVDQAQYEGYYDVVKTPMDLGTVGLNLVNDNYCSVEDFKTDLFLTLDNAITYFGEDHGADIRKLAEDVREKAIVEFQKLECALLQDEKDVEETDAPSRCCALCGNGDQQYRPPTLFCCQDGCNRKRIRRNAFYYAAEDSIRRVCCSACYEDDGAFVTILQDSGRLKQIPKKKLERRKNDETHEEDWAQCCTCDLWAHHACGLFNPHGDGEYCCPKCVLKSKERSIDDWPADLVSASDLPRTDLSEYLETHVRELVAESIEELARNEAESKGISINHAKQSLDLGGAITVRQLAATNRCLGVDERMQRRYAKYPTEFAYQSKCVAVFQNIDGVDVFLFAFCAYEHGQDNPAPNKGVVNISLLDSVHFMKPRSIRSKVYRETLIRYLDHARNRGFTKAYIWSCPPKPGDDYIFHCKPEDQKCPTHMRLREWYGRVFSECQQRGIVSKATNMYDLHFADGKDDATAIPYLAGDYFSMKLDEMLEAMEKEGPIVRLKKGSKDELMEKVGKKIKAASKNNYMVAFLDQTKRVSLDDAVSSPGILQCDSSEVDHELFKTGKFLDLCIQKHYHFGDFRLAKYSSLMLLWHLHHPGES